ncbi:MAG: prepilin peptidase [Zetaproteobacteria bacterium]|nr:prepilin peptidase [Zetaproteobacteria bacterium]
MSVFTNLFGAEKIGYLGQLILSWEGLLLLSFGLIFGSFYNVCIYRVPRDCFMASVRSLCPYCGCLIPVQHNIPLLSFLFLRGRSSCCSRKISLQYPAVELATACLFLLAYLIFPFLGLYQELYLNQFIRFAHMVGLCSVLLICSIIDMHHQIIPDRISLSMIVLAPFVAWVHPELALADSLWGVLFGGGLICAIIWIYYLVRQREGMGLGDAKLLAFIGGWLGYQAVLPTLMVGSVLGTMIAIIGMIKTGEIDGRMEIAFGPFLSLGAAFYMMTPTDIFLYWLG